MRYFVELNAENKPCRLYRFQSKDTLVEEVWHEGKWIDDKRMVISAMLCIGEGWYEEVPMPVAQKWFPDAFTAG